MFQPPAPRCCRLWFLGFVIWLSGAISSVFGQSAAELAPNVVVNPAGATYDSHPSVLVQADGTTWVAWHAYRESRDQILLRRVAADGMLGPIQTVSQQGVAHSPPQLVQLNQNQLWVIWSAHLAGRRHDDRRAVQD